MNTKTTKFLAVLAVLAMAFAGIAVIAPAEQNDAGDLPAGSVTVLAADTETVAGQWYVLNSDLTMTANITVAINVIILPGYQLTTPNASTGTVTFYQGTYDSSVPRYTYDESTKVTVTIKTGDAYVIGTNAETGYPNPTYTSSNTMTVVDGMYVYDGDTPRGTLYPIADYSGKDNFALNNAADYVAIGIPSASTADTSYALKATFDAYTGGGVLTNQVTVDLYKGATAANIKIAPNTLPAIKMTNQATPAGDATYSGTVAVTMGALTLNTALGATATTTAPQYLNGYITAVDDATSVTLCAPGNVTLNEAKEWVTIFNGTNMSGKYVGASSTSKYAEFDNDFIAKTDINLKVLYDGEPAAPASLNFKRMGASTAAAWEGVVTMSTLPVIDLGGALGKTVFNTAVSNTGATAATVLFDDVTFGTNGSYSVANGKTLTYAGGTMAKAKVVAGSIITVAESATASVSALNNTTEVFNLAGVTAGTGGATFTVTSLTNVTMAGVYTAGTFNSTTLTTVTPTSGMTAYSIKATSADLAFTATATTTTFAGDVTVQKFTISGAATGIVIFNGSKLAVTADSSITASNTFKTGQGSNSTLISTGTAKITINGPAVLAGKLNGEIDIASGSAVTASFEDFTVNTGGIVKISAHDSNKITVDGKMYLYGTLTRTENSLTTTPVEVKVAAGKSFIAFSGSAIDGRVLIAAADSTSIINIDQAQKDQEINKDITASKTYGQTENVVITGQVTVSSYAVVTILGGFQVNEGKTLIIKSGSSVIIDSAVASVIINGKVIVENGAVFTVTKANGVNISGTFQNKGAATLNSDVTVLDGGKVTDEGTAITFTTATVNVGGIIELKGDMANASSTIVNSGTVILSGVTMYNSATGITIKMAAKGAVVDIKSFNTLHNENSVSITDKDLKGNSTATGLVDKYANTITITPGAGETFKGLYIVEDTSYVSSKWYGKMDISGAATNVATATKAAAALSTFTVQANGGVTVKGALTLGKQVDLTFTGYDEDTKGVAVSGTITSVTEGSSVAAGTNALVTVTGTIETIAEIETASHVNAAKYEVDVEGTSHYYYTTLAKAIESEADEITITGTITITSDVTIPEDVEVTNTGIINVGTSSSRAVKVTVADGGVIRNGTVNVYGTLYFENLEGDSITVAVSDVTVTGSEDRMYTNIYSALDSADVGDTVTVTKTDGNVEISSDLTVKEGVTLEIPVSRAIELGSGVTLTINGTVMGVDTIKLSSKATGGWAEKASSIDKTAAIVIGPAGKLMTMSDMENALKEATSGVYFNLVDSIGNYYYVTNLPFAASKAANVTGGLLKVYGTVASISDIAVSGTSTQTAIVKVYGTLVAPLVLDYAILNLADADSFTGYVENDTGEVYIADINGITVASTVSSGKDVLTLAGTAGLNEDLDDDEYAVIEIVSGTVETDDTLKIEVESEVTDEGAYRRSVLVNVDSGATLSVGSSEITTLVVDGTLSVKNGKAFTAEHAIVCGTITVADKASTSSAFGAYKIDLISLGIGFELFTGASGTLAGDLGSYKDLKGLIAVPSATFDKELVKDAKHTTYMVGSIEYVTFYDFTSGTCYIDEIKVPHKDNATINGWTYGTDGAVVKSDDMVGKYDVVKASYNEYIYTVRIVTDAGVKSVAIDGIEMISSSNNSFQQLNYLKAGTHTVSYTLKSGYEGTAQLYTADGTILKDLKFTASGTPVGEAETVDLTFQLTGTEQIIAPEPTPVEQNEWTITTILLVILVILIAIMAVIVALRLNRS